MPYLYTQYTQYTRVFSDYMTEDKEETKQLSPFLFKKRPVDKSLIPSGGHSVITDIISHSTSPLSKKNSGGPDTSTEHDGKCCYNNIDYNEQIRAPRMSSLNHNMYKDKNIAEPFSAAPPSVKVQESRWDGEDKELDCDSKNDSYLPANFDLSQPMRRFSAPSDEVNDLLENTILSYTTNNYIYERNRSVSGSNYNSKEHSRSNTAVNLKSLNQEAFPSEQGQHENLLKALNNLSSNITTQERQNCQKSPRTKHRPKVMSSGHLSGVKGTDLQQVYQLKKPLCIPAVLRPQNCDSPTSSTSSRVSSSLDASPKKLVYSIPCSDANSSSSTVTLHDPVEPTHLHWKPNNSTSTCLKCFEMFGNFFTPYRRRRHHCRFCGLIFCFDCLWRGNNATPEADPTTPTAAIGSLLNLGVPLDAKARLVIPISENNKNKSLTLDQLFKYSKVCKDCGDYYESLIYNLNTNLVEFLDKNNVKDFKFPFIFIENTFLKNPENKVRDTGAAVVDSAPSSSDIHNNIMDANRKSSVASIPSDWTWSSF